MKITKSYLMQVIKEELGGNLGESVKKIVSHVESEFQSGKLDVSSLNNSLRLIERYFPQILNSLEGKRKAEAQRVMADLKSQVSAYRGPTDLTRGIGGGKLSKQGMRDAYKGLAGSAAKKGLPAPTTSSVRAGNDQNEQQLSKIIGLFKTLGSLATSNGGYSEFSGGSYREPASRGVNPQFVSGGSREVRENKITKSYLTQIIKEELEEMSNIGSGEDPKTNIGFALEEVDALLKSKSLSEIRAGLEQIKEYLDIALKSLGGAKGPEELDEINWDGIKRTARNAALGGAAAIGALGSSAKADDYDDYKARNQAASAGAYSATSPSWEDSQKQVAAMQTPAAPAQTAQKATNPERPDEATITNFINTNPGTKRLVDDKGTYAATRVVQAYLASKGIKDPMGTKANALQQIAFKAIEKMKGLSNLQPKVR